MAATKSVQKIKLSHLKCGDQTNDAWYGFYNENPSDAEQTIQLLIAPNAMDEITSAIFDSDINGDVYRRILMALTLYEEYGKRVNDTNATLRKAQILFFALLVNYNSTMSRAVPGFKSYEAAREAAANAKNDGREVDYREYIISGENTNWNNEYKTILTTNKDYSVQIQVKLPIVHKRFGTWKFATERIPGIMELIGDPDNNKLIIPAPTWMEMVSEAIGKRITTRFSKLDEKSLNKIVKIDDKVIDDILYANNYKSVIHFANVYDMDINDNNELVLQNTNDLPNIENASGFEWNDIGHDDWALNCSEFYIVKMTGNTVHVMQER